MIRFIRSRASAAARAVSPSSHDPAATIRRRSKVMTTQWDISDRARAVHARSLVWDAHACLPLVPGTSMEALERHRRAGISFVSVNVGMDMNPLAQVMRV